MRNIVMYVKMHVMNTCTFIITVIPFTGLWFHWFIAGPWMKVFRVTVATGFVEFHETTFLNLLQIFGWSFLQSLPNLHLLFAKNWHTLVGSNLGIFISSSFPFGSTLAEVPLTWVPLDPGVEMALPFSSFFLSSIIGSWESLSVTVISLTSISSLSLASPKEV